LKKVIWLLLTLMLTFTCCQSGLVLGESQTGSVTISQVECETTDPANPVDHLFDNDPQTLWQTTAALTGETKLKINLEQAVFLDYFELSGVLESKQTVSIDYYASDGFWRPLIGCRKIPLTNGRIDLSLNNVKTASLRLTLAAATKNQTLGGVGEVKVYGHQTPDLIYLKGQITTSGSIERDPLEYLNDHNTYTTRKLQPESITVQLGQSSIVKKLKLYLQKGAAVLNFSAWVNGKWEPFGTKLDLNTVNSGWYSVAGPGLSTAQIQINVVGETTDSSGGIGEIEVWGDTSAACDQIIALGDSLTGIREFGLELAEQDVGAEVNLWLVLPSVTPDWKPQLNINGTSVAAPPAVMNCNGATLGKVTCDGDLLRQGHNVIVADFGAVTVTNAVLSLTSDKGCLKTKALVQSTGVLPGLTDGLKFSELSGPQPNIFELQLESTASIDYLKLYSTQKVDLGKTIVWVWQNQAWHLIPTAQLDFDGDQINISNGVVPTEKIKLAAPQGVRLNEIQVYGSKVTQAAPQITLSQPAGSTLAAGSVVQVEGFVDNAAAAIAVNGQPQQLQGHFFSCPVFVNSTASTFNVQITAVDGQGRKGTLEKTFAINKSPSTALPVLQCELPERYYTASPTVTVKGTALHANVVTVNSTAAALQGGTGVYSQEMNLDEGENKVVITAKSASGALVNLERRIVRDTQPPVLLISDITKADDKAIITGTCHDASPVELTINGQQVDVSVGSFSYTTKLNIGVNLFTVTAKDAVGNETSKEISVTQETALPSGLLKASVAGESEPLKVDFPDIAAQYEAPGAKTNQGISPFGAWFNNNKESVSPISGSLMINAKDLELPGRDGFDLEIIRMYSSEKAQTDFISPKEKPKEKFDSFGAGWMVNIPWISDGQLILPNGQNIKFGGSSKFEYHEGVHFVLEYNATSKGYTLTMGDGIRYLFDDTGKATAKISPNGKNSICFSYTGNEITKITDSIGREVKFTYKTVGTKRLIQSIQVNGRIIEYDYYDNGLLKWVSDPLKRKTEYQYTCFAGKQYGQKYRFKKKYFEVISFHGDEIGEIKTYDLYLLERINYPTGLASTYTYYNNTFSQNYDWGDLGYFHYRHEKFPVKEQTIGSRQISFYYKMNPQSGGIHTDVDFPREQVEKFDVNFKNRYILATTMVETGGKTVKYNLQHVVKTSGNYAAVAYPPYKGYDYVAPALESSQVSDGSKEFEKVKYQYQWNILEPTLEQHFRGSQETYHVTNDYDTWGNLTSQTDSRTGFQKVITYLDHVTVKNLPEKVTLINYNPATNSSSQIITTYKYNPDYLKPESVTVNTGSKNMVTGYTYYANGNLRSKTNPNGLVEMTEYDETFNAFPVKKTFQGLKDVDGKAAEAITNQSGCNYFGLKEWEMDGRGYVTYYVYDDINRVKYIYLPDDDDTPFALPSQAPVGNLYREYKYDDAANTCEFWNENRQKTLYRFDGLGRLTKETKYNGSRYSATESDTIYHYNDLGQINYVTDPNNHTTNYQYDGLGRVKKVTYPTDRSAADSSYAQLDYDDAGNTVTVRQENGNIVVHKKDWADRLVAATQQAVYNGSSDTYQWSFQYDSLGNKVQQTNPLSEITNCTFDPMGHLERVQLPGESLVTPGSTGKETVKNPGKLQPTTVYEYDEMGHKIKETDANGNQTEYEYDGLGRLLLVKKKVTKTNLTTKYGETNTVVTKYYYDQVGNKVKTIDPNSHVWQNTYSARGFLLSEATPDGNVTQYGYDPLGNKIAVIDPRNTAAAPKIWYSFNGEQLVLKDSRTDKTFTTWYLYDDYNRLYRTVMPDNTPPSNPFEAAPGYDNPYTETWYDLVGNKEAERDTTGQTTNYTYYPRNWLKTVSGPGKKEAYEYDAVGNQTVIRIWTDIAANSAYSIIKQYDSLGRLRQVTFPESKEEYTYDPFGNCLTAKDGNGNLTEYQYNNLGWQTTVTDPLKNTTTYRYDPNGNKVATLTAKGLCLINRYDELNRVVESLDSLGVATLYSYDSNGNLSGKLDPRQTNWEYIYNDNNTLKQLNLTGADQTTYTVNYTYDKAGNRLIVSDTGKLKNLITYNDQIPDPLNRINAVERQFDGKTYRMEYEYNPAGQLKAVQYPEATAKINYQYNASGQLNEVIGFTKPEGITYYDDGLPKNITLANNVNTQYSYNASRRLQDINVSLDNTGLIKLDYLYDAAGNIKTITDKLSEKQTNYTYHENNWLKSESAVAVFSEKVTGDPGCVSKDSLGVKPLDFSSGGLVYFDYAASSIGVDFGFASPNIKKIELIPGSNYTASRIIARGVDIYTSPDNITFTKIPRSGWTLSKDSKGVVTLTLNQAVKTRIIKIHSVVDDLDPDGNTLNKASLANDLDQIIRVYEETDGTKVSEYQYDGDGNRKLRSVKLTALRENKYYYYPDSNRLFTDEEYGYVYDEAGNLKQKGNKFAVDNDTISFTATEGAGVEYWEYDYDLMNRLIEVRRNNKTVAQYGYDPEGYRVVKTTSAGTTHYVFEGTEPVFEKKLKSGKIKSYIYALGRHLARVDGVIGDTAAKVYYYHTDHIGSIRKITDQQGQEVWNADYAAFGTQEHRNGSIDELHSFTGKELDQDTGLYYYNARWYDSELGRFISEDPATDPNNPNLYSYCGNNPVVRVDPSGRFWGFVAKLAVGWLFNAAREGVEAHNDGGNFFEGFLDGLFFNPSVSVSGTFGSGGISFGERRETTGSIEYGTDNNYSSQGASISYCGYSEEYGPTLYEAAELAHHIYEGRPGKKLPGGWAMVEEPYENKKGSLRMGVYARVGVDGKTEYVIVNAGTADLVDWKNNFQQPFGKSRDMWDSINYAKNFVAKNSNANITFVGHSKGGGEAAANAIATNCNAILFNPSPINFHAYKLNSSTYTGKMTSYVVKGEILYNIFGPISKPANTVYLPSQYSVYTISEAQNLLNSIKNHLMPAVKKAIIEYEGEWY
jgi:RHS repeat-associated protein